MEDILQCIHGMDFDSCAICCDRDYEYISEEVKTFSSEFNWRDTANYHNNDEVEYDNDYDIEIDLGD